MKKGLLVLLFLVLILGCEKTDNGGDGCGLGLSGPVVTQSVSELSPDTIVGDWRQVDETGQTTGAVFAADGTIPDKTDSGQVATWCLSGNVVSLNYEQTVTETDANGNPVEAVSLENWATTAALLDGRLYTKTAVRVSGNGAALDGNWVLIEQESIKDNTGALYEKGRLDISITGVTYTWVSQLSYEAIGAYEPVEPENVECSGTVSVDGDRVLLTPLAENNGDCYEAEFLRIDDNAMLFAQD